MKNIKENKYNAVFSGQEVQFEAKEFTGATLTAVFGGIDLDLSKTTITQDAVIKVRAIFGGIDIKVPEEVKVKVEGFSLFGGISNKKKKQTESETTITLHVKSFCLFGGCDIK